MAIKIKAVLYKIKKIMHNVHNRVEKNQGFALIFVMAFVAMIIGIAGDIVYQTQINSKNIMIQENKILAKTAAQTGLEFAKLLLNMNKFSQNYQNNPLLPIPKNLYNLLNGQPIGAESFEDIKNLTGINLSSAISPEILNGLKAMKGYFVINITSENAKFNLNLLQSTYSSVAAKALLRLFSAPDSQKFLELYNYTPQKLVENLIAYIKISTNDASLDARVMEDYRRLALKYLPKHAALESLEELRRIPGFEIDDIYNMFSPYFTIWPISGPQNSLNINSAPPELIAPFFTPLSIEIDQQAWDKFEDYRFKNTFAQNNISSWFQSNLPSYTQDKDADEIRRNIFGATDSIYKIECRGVVNNFEKKVISIIQIAQSNSPSSPTTPNGAPSMQTPNGSQPGGALTPPPLPKSPIQGTTGQPGDGNPPTLPNAPAGNQKNPMQNPQTNLAPFNIIYSQWVD